jgi:S-adenosylmethionine:tRNA ribosyltransferase-isomerase
MVVDRLATLLPVAEAAEPPEARGLARDEVRLLVSHAGSRTHEHACFRDLPRFLRQGDLLVVNTSGTLNAALAASAADGRRFALHLSTQLPGGFWVVEVRQPAESGSEPFRGAHPNLVFELDDGGRVTLLAPYPLRPNGGAGIRLWLAAIDVALPLPDYLAAHGRPIRYGYVRRRWPSSMYQTVFANEPGSAEMPSAARPFTHALVTQLVAAGINIAPLVLHTGVSSLEDHEPPYEEYFRVPAATADAVNATRRRGDRVVAVGTTVIRALESVTDEHGLTHPGEGWTSVIISASRPLRAPAGLVTGLHEPSATHLELVRQVLAAAGGRDPESCLTAAYRAAASAGYLWHEFGDSHLILP